MFMGNNKKHLTSALTLNYGLTLAFNAIYPRRQAVSSSGIDDIEEKWVLYIDRSVFDTKTPYQM